MSSVEQSGSSPPDDIARLSTEAVRVIAQSVPNMTTLTDAAAAALAPDAEYRLREIVQDSIKFMKHSKRARLMPNDVNAALRLRNVEPIYGFGSADATLTHPTGNGVLANNHPLPASTNLSESKSKGAAFNQVDGIRDLFFVEDSEVNVKALLETPVPPLPLEITVSSHWLAVDGVQPAISQNPARHQLQLSENHDAEVAQSDAEKSKIKTEVKPVLKHVLSRELQLYYDHVTGAFFGDDAAHLDACLDSVAQEPGLVQLLPYFTRFVRESVVKSVRNLPLLFSLMRLVNAILDNDVLQLENYLHQLLPAVITCLVGKRLCEKPRENHWALRDYTAKLIRRICARYSKDYLRLQPRITKTLVSALSDSRRPLTTQYGAIIGTASLGQKVVESLLLPELASYGSKVRKLLEDPAQKPVRRFEAAKVFGALAWAMSIPWLDPESAARSKESLSMSQASGSDKFVVSKAKLSEVLPNSEQLQETLWNEFGEKLYPCDWEQQMSVSEMAKSISEAAQSINSK